MWSTIANFKDNLTQIASDVLDTADEFKTAGSQDDFDGLYDSHETSHRSNYSSKEADLKAELDWYRTEVPRLQAAESEIQLLSTKYVALLKEREDELSRFREENELLKEKLIVAASENGSQAHIDLNKGDQLQEALKELKSKHEITEELHQKIAELQDYHRKDREALIAEYKQELATARALCETNCSSAEKAPLSSSNGPTQNQGGPLDKLEARVLQLQQNEKELASQLSEKDEIYGKLRTAFDKCLSEIRRLKEQLSKDKDASVLKDSQLQREHEDAETALKECEALRLENLKISRELDELQKSSADQDVVNCKGIEELQLAISTSERKVVELEEERDKLLKALQDHEHGLLEKAPSAAAELVTEEELLALRETAKEVDRLLERVKVADEDSASAKRAYEEELVKVNAERDKATRDLARLKQHLLDKELADSEKMDQDSERIADLQARADVNFARAIKAEEALALTLADLRKASKHSKEELSRATEEIEMLQRKLASCIAALESKDVELSNLQSALGQYYAESEARDRSYLELSAVREENAALSVQLQAARRTIEVKNEERDAALEKLTLVEERALQSQQNMQKLEEEVVRLRRALEQSMTQLNSLSSDSDQYVDRRIVIKLLVTYFQRNHSKEVLDLMVRMLGFSEEDKRRVGLAQQAAGRSVVRGVLGLPGRFVGGLIGSASADSLSLPIPSENQSFADLWIDFLLKESEERERRERAEADVKAEKKTGRDGYGSAPSDGKLETFPEPPGYISSASAKGSISTPPSPSRQIMHRPTSSFSNFSSVFAPSSDLPYKNDMPSTLPRSAKSELLISESSDVIGNEFSSIPLNSSAPVNSVLSHGHSKLPPRF